MCFNDPERKLQKTLAEEIGDADDLYKLDRFMTNLALCHTVVIDSATGKFNASSPDELALVNFAKQVGYSFEGEDNDKNVTVETPHGPKKFQLLHVCNFTSTRKRMSVIVRDEEDQIRLICKGADSIIRNILT